MILGFTGTRNKTTREQNTWLLSYLLGSGDDERIDEFHHGCCRGADAQAHRTARQCTDLTVDQIVLHPPSNSKDEMEYEAWDYANCVWYPRKRYLERNMDIVVVCDGLLVLPDSKVEKARSGTWTTYRYALQKKKPIIICYPDGEVVKR